MSGGEPTRRPERLAWAALAWVACALGLPAHAQPFHGRVEVQEAGSFARDDSLDAALGEQQRNDILGDARLTWEPSKDNWSFALHYEVSVQYGDSARLARLESGLQ